MTFGIVHLAPLLPDFFKLCPDVSVDLSLSDQIVDIVSEGFDLALRISSLPDSSLLARRLCQVRVLLVGAPAYFGQHGRPEHPKDLAAHIALLYSYSRSRDVWHFSHPKQGEYSVAVSGPIRANNADVLQPSLCAGAGLALQPEFLVWRDIAEGRLEAVLKDWSAPPAALHLVTPPSPMRPVRVQVLMDFLAQRFTRCLGHKFEDRRCR